MGSETRLVHVKVYVSGTLPAKVSQVWEVVRNYGQAEAWLTGAGGVKTFTKLLPGQINCQIGAIRLVTIGQRSFVDQLDGLDDDQHVMKYKLISHPLNANPFPGPFLNYRAVIRLREVTRGNLTFMEWTGEFDTQPQDCQVMRQAIAERFEAGFQGLEQLWAPARTLYHTTSLGRGGIGGNTGNRFPPSESGGSLRAPSNAPSRPAAAAMPTATSNRSPRAGHASEMSIPAHPRGVHESNSGSSLASSPHYHETVQRPGSGHMMQQWTSGGSGSTIHLSTLPLRFSGEEAHPTGNGIAGKRQQSRAWMHNQGQPMQQANAEPAGPPQAAVHPQVGARQVQPSAFELHQRATQEGAQAAVAPPRRLSQRSPTEPHLEGTIPGDPMAAFGFRQPPDSHTQDREEFKARLLAQRFQHLMHKGPEASHLPVPTPTAQSEPDWSRVHLEDKSAGSSLATTPFASTGIPGTDDDTEWARLMQQREEDLREAQARRSRSPVPTTEFGAAGPFGAAQTVPAGAFAGAAGPFAAASAAGLPPLRGMPQSASHQSLSSLGGTPSGAMDRSAGSTLSHGPEEVIPQRDSKASIPEGAVWSST